MSGAGSDTGVPGRLVFSRTPAGDPVAECELAAGDTGLLSELARQAACHGAVLLWVHCAADLSKAGFAARQGYRRFTAAAVPPGDPLPLLDNPGRARPVAASVQRAMGASPVRPRMGQRG